MGVDYYIITTLKITYTNDENDYIDLSKEGKFFWHEVSYDSDSEGARERAFEEEKKLQEKELASHNEEKLLFVDGQWHITSQSKIEDYKELISERRAQTASYTDRFVGADVKSIKKIKYARLR